MDIDFIVRLLDLVEHSKIAELELTLDGERIRLVKSAGRKPETSANPSRSPPFATPAPAQPQALERLHAVRAGFPGTFYRAAAPGERPFVAEGDLVEDGSQIGILEAMKTMNPLEADIAGTIRRIVLDDATPVETGDLLFEIEPLAEPSGP